MKRTREVGEAEELAAEIPPTKCQAVELGLFDLPIEMLCSIVGFSPHRFEEYAALYLTCRRSYQSVPDQHRSLLVRFTISNLRLHSHIVGVYEMLAFQWSPLLDEFVDTQIDNTSWSLDAPFDQYRPLQLLNTLFNERRYQTMCSKYAFAFIGAPTGCNAQSVLAKRRQMMTNIHPLISWFKSTSKTPALV